MVFLKNILFYSSILFLFASCSNFTHKNWRIKLINDYEIWCLDRNHIEIGLVKKNSNVLLTYWNYNLIGVPPKVIKFSINQQYICAITDSCNNIENAKNKSGSGEYYIINTLEQKTIGPMTESEYKILANGLSINITNWLDTEYINKEWLEKNGYYRIWTKT